MPLKNSYNTFRGVGNSFEGFEDTITRPLSRTFDEPTYYTFKLEFGHRDIDNALDNTDFDRIPQPLFSPYSQDDLMARNYYSTYQYLRDNNEILRGYMLSEFIAKWRQMQDEYQWYFQSISGLNSLMNILPGRGRRVGNDARLTISMLEGLDQKVTHLLNLYRKIAWDDDYQRWILPDMMRYFRITLYVTEFRSFHKSNYPGFQAFNPDTGQSFRQEPGEGSPMILSLLNGVMPTYILDLERCEFDLETFNVLPDSINIGEAEMRQLEFGIKVGNFKERYVNPIFNSFWYDILINGFARTAQNEENGSNETLVLSNSNQGSNLIAEGVKAQENLLATDTHQSGQPFVQTGNLDNIHNSSPNYSINAAASNPIDPTTWVGNTINLGKSLVSNLVESKVDELKMAKIPGLGISFNEALAAIQSKNVFTLFGAARRALNDTIANTLPSQELESNLVDTQFRNFLLGITQSEATDGDALELKQAANIVLNDRGQWEKIKDLSLATDLLSTALGEINSATTIQNRNALKTAYQEAYVPLAVKDYLVYEGVPSSVSTIERSLEGQKIQQPLSSQATAPSSKQIETGSSAELGSTDGQLSGGSTIAPSSQLGESAGESLPQGESGLGSSAEGGLVQPSLSDRKIEGDRIYLPEPGEAVDSDPIEAKPLPIPNPSQATNNKLQS
jgi:hypothetical protein